VKIRSASAAASATAGRAAWGAGGGDCGAWPDAGRAAVADRASARPSVSSQSIAIPPIGNGPRGAIAFVVVKASGTCAKEEAQQALLSTENHA